MLTITLPEEIETKLKAQASRCGIDAAELAKSLIENELHRIATDPTIALLEQWDREDATDDPEELARREKEGEEFMQNLNRNRMEMEGPNARKIWP